MRLYSFLKAPSGTHGEMRRPSEPRYGESAAVVKFARIAHERPAEHGFSVGGDVFLTLQGVERA